MVFGFRRPSQRSLEVLKYVTAVLVVVWTAISVPLGLAIWPSAVGRPPQQLLPLFTSVLVFEGAAFAVGVVFIVYGGRILAAASPSGRWNRAAYVSIAWLLVNWWPHDGLHRTSFGRTFAGLATIDIAFHTTLILATAVVAYFFMRTIRSFNTIRTASR